MKQNSYINLPVKQVHFSRVSLHSPSTTLMVVLSEVRQVNPSKATAQIDVTTSRGDNTKPNTICQQYHEKRINKNNDYLLTECEVCMGK